MSGTLGYTQQAVASLADSPEHIKGVVGGGNSSVAAVAELLPRLFHKQQAVLHVHQGRPKPGLLRHLPPLMQAVHILND